MHNLVDYFASWRPAKCLNLNLELLLTTRAQSQPEGARTLRVSQDQLDVARPGPGEALWNATRVICFECIEQPFRSREMSPMERNSRQIWYA